MLNTKKANKSCSIKLWSFVILFLVSFGLVQAQSPNILLIIADDLGVDALNGYNLGSINPTTPHLDSLRNSGITFTNAWASPVCSPTRAGIMSGKYGSKNGVKTIPGTLDTSHISVLKALKNYNSSYKTGVVGKWHLAQPAFALHPIWHGADHYMGTLGGAVPDYYQWNKTENGSTSISTDYATSSFTDDAINWLSSQNQPWFLWLAHVAPHTPLHIPPANMHSQPSTNTPLKKYMAMIESLDFDVGRLLDSMTPTEKANTVIIFIGDNGTPNTVLQDYPSKHGKGTLYQGGVHVPMFVSGKGVTRIGETENALINVIDIYATALELSGATLPGGIYNSLSFKSLLSNANAVKRLYNFVELDSNNSDIKVQGFAIRDTVYKLIEYYDGQQEMYDLIVDPLELNDLLLGNLTPQQQTTKTILENEAAQRRNSWSCDDNIQNGDEDGIDCGGTYCSPCSTTSINSFDVDQDVFVYPNPTSNYITIKTYENTPTEIKIFNTLGDEVLSKKVQSSTITSLDISLLSAGVYFVHVKQNSKLQVLKIVKSNSRQ